MTARAKAALQLCAFGLVFSVLASGVQVAAQAAMADIAERALVQAIALINGGESRKAYTLLEQKFPQASQKVDKARMALLLALAPRQIELRRPRFVYAKHAAENLVGLSDEMLRRLMRVRADSLLAKGKVTLAKQAYQELLSMKQMSLGEREYATYRLGWTYINQARPDRAFRLWQNWLMQYESGILRARIVQDSGLAWSESIAMGTLPVVRLGTGMQELQNNFLQGVVKEVSQRSSQAHTSRVTSALQRLGLKDQFERRISTRKGEQL